MPASITIRNVPDDVRDELASRAALAGKSLQEHLLAELVGLARRPSVEALVERIRARKRATGSRLPAKRILAHRDRDPEVTVVLDASAVVAALADSGEDGEWATAILLSGPLAAPALMPVEAANILRRAALARELSEDAASQAHAELLDLRVELFPYEPFAARVWELRRTITAYDGWYVALAEALDADLATLDLRLRRSAGPRCAFVTPAGHSRP